MYSTRSANIKKKSPDIIQNNDLFCCISQLSQDYVLLQVGFHWRLMDGQFDQLKIKMTLDLIGSEVNIFFFIDNQVLFKFGIPKHNYLHN